MQRGEKGNNGAGNAGNARARHRHLGAAPAPRPARAHGQIPGTAFPQLFHSFSTAFPASSSRPSGAGLCIPGSRRGPGPSLPRDRTTSESPRGWRGGHGEDTAGRGSAAFPSPAAPGAAPGAARTPSPALREIPTRPFPPQGRRRPHRPCSGCFSVLSEVSWSHRDAGMRECGERDRGSGHSGSQPRVCPAGIAVDALEFP